MINQHFSLVCDSCGREHKEHFDTVRDLLKYSKKDGWIEKVVPNGSTWAFCPKCVQEGKHEETK